MIHAAGTAICSGDVKVYTIEHEMVLYAAGVDNCLIELTGPEMPILDGSAKLISEKISEVGIVEQEEDALVYVVRQRSTIKDETEQLQ